MLQKLVINNYAIIDSLAMEPDAHLNTVTGETGAGKSIILGALSLILGERADTSVLINKEDKSVVEGYFDVKGNEAFQKALAEEELDQDDQCIIRREITPGGKSRTFVNDTPVTLNVLNRLTSLLVDLNQQFGHLALEDDNFQCRALDAAGDTLPVAASYKTIYDRHRRVRQQLTAQEQKQAQWQKEADYKQYLLDELVQASFKNEEIEAAELQLKQMGHSERILSVLQGARAFLAEGEPPVLNELKRMAQQLQGLADLVPAVAPLQERMSSVWAELKDIADELENEEGRVVLDPKEMALLQERIDTGYKLLKKHSVKTTKELLAIQNTLEDELKATLDLNEAIARLAKEEAAGHKELLAAADKLSGQRKKSARTFSARINELLTLVGMPNARFEVQIEATVPGPLGADHIRFMLDANKSGQFQPLQKAASGGEMSRIMLCIKSLTAEALRLPTLIFDEVDTGISGEAARQVGTLLRQLSRHHQVICITHQPQVAARGSRHFYVYKEAGKNQWLYTRIRVLQQDERVLAIARMIGGEEPSEAAISNARELFF